MRILGIDLGWRHLAVADVEWSPKVRRCHKSCVFKSTDTMSESYAWLSLLIALDSWIKVASDHKTDRIALEDTRGVRYGKSERGRTNANADKLIELQGAVRLACVIHDVPLYIVQSRSVYAALHCQVPKISGESEDKKRKRQKLSTATTVKRVISGAEHLTEDETDACAHAIAVALGKGTLV